MWRSLIGILAGWALWLAFVAMDFMYRPARKYIPRSIRAVPDFLMLGVQLSAWPIGLGGWIWVWGDAGPPFWAKGVLPNVAVGLIVFGVLGVIGSSVFTRLKFGLGRILITLIVLLLVLAAIAKVSL